MTNSITYNEHTCPACNQIFKTIHGQNNHLVQSRNCARYNKQQFDFSDDSEQESDIVETGQWNGNGVYKDDEDPDLEPQEEMVLNYQVLMQSPAKKQRIEDTTATIHNYYHTAGKIFHIDKSVQEE